MGSVVFDIVWSIPVAAGPAEQVLFSAPLPRLYKQGSDMYVFVGEAEYRGVDSEHCKLSPHHGVFYRYKLHPCTRKVGCLPEPDTGASLAPRAPVTVPLLKIWAAGGGGPSHLVCSQLAAQFPPGFLVAHPTRVLALRCSESKSETMQPHIVADPIDG